MTVYESLKSMSKADFVNLCLTLYYKGQRDGRELVDDAAWIHHRLPDWPVEKMDEIE